MKYNELFTVADGVFTIFQENFPNEFGTLFEGNTAESLNIRAMGIYGNKTLINSLTAENKTDYINAVIGTEVGNWLKINDALLAQYDAGSTVDMTETVTTGRTYDNTDTGSTSRAEKAFNDIEFKDNERQQTNDARKGTETENKETHKSGFDNSKGGSFLIQKEIELRRQGSIFRYVADDLIGGITISIYE